MRTLLASFVLALAAAGAQAETINVITTSQAGQFIYSPSDVQILAGDRVHFAASTTHPFRMNLNPSVASTTALAFGFPGTTAGNTYNFFCFNHGGMGMVGTVTVSDNPDLIYFDEFESGLVPTSTPGG